jgi:hypothetical protein
MSVLLSGESVEINGLYPGYISAEADSAASGVVEVAGLEASGYSESRSGSNHLTPPDWCFH